MMGGVEIVGLGHSLPDRRVTSDELASEFRRSDGRPQFTGRVLTRLTGIRERRYVEHGQASSDLAAEAAKVALASSGIEPSSVDTLIFASASHDVAEPATANRVQMLTGLSASRCLDVKNACNSFLDGVDVARSMILCGSSSIALVSTGEVLSPFVQMTIAAEHEVSQLVPGLTLGDAGGAVVLRAGDDGDRLQVGPGRFRSIGQHWDASWIAAGGSMHGRDYSRAYFVSDSRVLFGLAVEHVSRVVIDVVAAQGWELDEVDLVIPHQASAKVTKAICSRVGIPYTKCVLTGDMLGNTAAASIPVALSLCRLDGRLQSAQKVLLVGGAAGFSAGVVPLCRA